MNDGRNPSLVPLTRHNSFLMPSFTGRNSISSNSLYSQEIIQASFSSFGLSGLAARISIFLLDIVTDGLVLAALWYQSRPQNPYLFLENEEKHRFRIAAAIIIIPTVVNNILSLYWYFRKHKVILQGRNVLHDASLCKKIICVLLHFTLLGQLVRYIDSYNHEKAVMNYLRHVKTKDGCSPRRFILGVRSAGPHKVLTGDSANLDFLRSYLQDCPVILLQIFILYRNHLVTQPEFEKYKQWNLAATILLIKCFVAWLFVIRSTVLYQSMTSHCENYIKTISKAVCLLWRSSEIGARVIAIGSFAALRFNNEGVIHNIYEEAFSKGLTLSFPLLAAIILIGHWCIMVIWIYSQNTSFCGGAPQQKHKIREFVYDLFLAWAHTFVYINLKDTPTRRRMIFFYSLIFVENTVLLAVWYMQMKPIPLWLKVSIPFAGWMMFLVAVCCCVAYYAFLHKVDIRQEIFEDTSK